MKIEPVIDLVGSLTLGNIRSTSAMIKKVYARGLEYAFLALRVYPTYQVRQILSGSA